MRSAVSSTTVSWSGSPISAGTISMPVVPESRSVSRMLSAPRSLAHTSPTREPGWQARDLVDELEVAGTDEHRDDRHPAGGEHLGLVGVERRRRDEVVVEAVEPFGQVVDQRALGLDHAGERVDQPLGVVARVGVRALGEEDADERPGPLALGGRGERRGGDLVGGEPGVRRAAEHLGDDAGEGLRAAALRRPVGDVGAGAMAAR